MVQIETWSKIKNELKDFNAALVAVSKTQTIEAISILYKEGQRIFGENRVQELVQKQELLEKDIQWHQIGTLQRNKVKYIAPFVSLIHSIDNYKLLKEVNKQAKKHNRTIDCLLQFHVAKESSKFGFDPTNLKEFEKEEWQSLKNINIIGVMGMASFSSDKNLVRSEFKLLKHVFDSLKEKHFLEKQGFKEISMGMSGDYQIALEEGSTMVRVGSLLFGAR